MNGHHITCDDCSGHGVTLGGNPYDPEPFECKTCDGSGRVWKYNSGHTAKWLGGPFIGKDELESRL